MTIGELLTWMRYLLLAPIILSNKPVQSLKCHPQALRVILFQRWWWVFPTLWITKYLGFLNHLLFLLQQKCPSTITGWVQLHHTARLPLTQRTALLALKHGEVWAVFSIFKGYIVTVQLSGLTGTCIYLCPSRTVTACDLRQEPLSLVTRSQAKCISFALTASFWVTSEFFLDFLPLVCASEKALTTIAYLYCSVNCKHLLIHPTNDVKITQWML